MRGTSTSSSETGARTSTLARSEARAQEWQILVHPGDASEPVKRCRSIAARTTHINNRHPPSWLEPIKFASVIEA
jgi:hypothetical protein